jgi:hypothetical protein
MDILSIRCIYKNIFGKGGGLVKRGDFASLKIFNWGEGGFAKFFRKYKYLTFPRTPREVGKDSCHRCSAQKL